METLIKYTQRNASNENKDQWFVSYKFYYLNNKYGVFGEGTTEKEADINAKLSLKQWCEKYEL